MTDRSEDFPGLRQPFKAAQTVDAKLPSNVAVYSQQLASSLNAIRARASLRTLIIQTAVTDVATAIEGTGLDVLVRSSDLVPFAKMQEDRFDVWLARKDEAGAHTLPLYSISVKKEGGLTVIFHITNAHLGTNNVGTDGAQGVVTLGTEISKYLGQVAVAEAISNLHLGIAPKKPERPKVTRGRGVTRITEGG